MSTTLTRSVRRGTWERSCGGRASTPRTSPSGDAARDAGVRQGATAEVEVPPLVRRDRAGAPAPAQRTSSRPSSPGRRRRSTSWEKHTRSWSCSPRARTPTPSRSRDRGALRRSRGGDLDSQGMRAARGVAGDALPAASSPGPRPAATTTVAAECTRPGRTRAHPLGAALAGVLRPGTGADLGPSARRHHLPVLDLDHVPASCHQSARTGSAAASAPIPPRRSQSSSPASRSRSGPGTSRNSAVPSGASTTSST